VEHIRSIADTAPVARANLIKAEAAAAPSSICGNLLDREDKVGPQPMELLSKSLVRSFNASIGVSLALVILYLIGNRYWLPAESESGGLNSLVRSGWDWLLWLFIGVALHRKLSDLEGLIARFKGAKERVLGFGFIALALVLPTLLVIGLVATRTSIQFDFAILEGGADFGDMPDGFLQALGFVAGYFYQLIINFFINVACVLWEGILGPIRELLRKR
jgi:hypothetical protein